MSSGNGNRRVAEVFREYLLRTRHHRSEESQRNVGLVTATVIDIVVHELRYRRVRQLDEDLWRKFQEHMEAVGYADSTRHRYGKQLKTLIRWAQKRDLLAEADLPEDPAEWTMRKSQEHPDRSLSSDEIEELLDGLRGDWMRRPVGLAIYQGVRRGEVLLLQYKDVDVDADMLTVGARGRTKDRSFRRIPVHPRTYEFLPDSIPDTDEWVVTLPKPREEYKDPRGAFTRAFRRRADSLGFPDLRFHDLRHTCASHMARSGEHTLYQIQKFLGHSSIQQTERYAHLLPSDFSVSWGA